MSITTYKAGIDTDIVQKQGIPASVPATRLGQAYKDLADEVNSLIAGIYGGVVPADADTLAEVSNKLIAMNNILGSSGKTIDQLVIDIAAKDSGSAVDTKISNAINALIGGAPSALDALNELATAMGNDPNFATTMTNLIATKEPAIGAKGTAFNKNFGTGAGQVAEGNHGHTTDQVQESGAPTNKWWTNARTITAVLTGYAISGVNAALAAGDSISQAFGKLEKRINDIIITLGNKANLSGGTVPLSEIPVLTQDKLPLVDIYPNFNNKFFKDEGGSIIGINPFELFARELIEGQMHGWTPQWGAATVIGIGVPSANMSTTVTPRNYDATSYLSSERRVQVLGAATAGTRIGQRDAVPRFSTKWGFRGRFRFCATDAAVIAGVRSFCGFTPDTGTMANAEPSSMLNILSVANDSADTTLQVIYNDGVGAATKIDLGLNFPANTINTDIYDVFIAVMPGGGSAIVAVFRVSGADGTILATTTKQITGGLPDLTVALCSQNWRTNNATALAPSIDVMASFFHTKYI